MMIKRNVIYMCEAQYAAPERFILSGYISGHIMDLPDYPNVSCTLGEAYSRIMYNDD